jgi:hypothetical protein
LEKRVLLYFYSNNFLGHIPTILLLLILLVVLLPFVIMAGLAPIGMALAGRRSQTILLWLLLFAYLLPHVLILSEDRFHLAMVPFLAILASCAWFGGRTGIHELWTKRPQDKISLLLSGIAILFLTANWVWELWRDWDKLVQLLGVTGNMLFFPY